MYGGRKKGGFGKVLAGLAFLYLIYLITGVTRGGAVSSFWSIMGRDIAREFADALCVQYIPMGAQFAGETGADWLVRTQTGSFLPLYGRSQERKTGIYQAKGEEAISQEPKEEPAKMKAQARQEEAEDKEELLALLEAENQAAAAIPDFQPHSKRVEVDLEQLSDYGTLVERFYTIDANTMAGTEQLNIEKLLAQDVSIDREAQGPQILIYHTHSQEGFVDSVPGDVSTTIVGVGERLAQILQEEYGYSVLHHTGQYDVDSRDDAYGEALPALKQLLAENPTIQVVIDLHRDQMPEETKLVMDLDGRPTARFMFFNGLSRTKQSGEIDYLQNENIEMNLAASFQMQLKCEEYYPGLTRKIYLKGYRYNMHLCPRTLLVELGAQNNTVEEAMNACDPLAHVIHMVLSGE